MFSRIAQKFVQLSDLQKLFEFVDDSKLKAKFSELSPQIRAGYKRLIFLKIVINLVYILLTLDISYSLFQESGIYFSVIIFYFLNKVLGSFDANIFYFKGEIITQSLLLKVYSRASDIFPNKEKILITRFAEVVSSYFFSLASFISNAITIVSIFVMILLGKGDSTIKLILCLFILFLMIVISFAGKMFINNNIKLGELFASEEDIEKVGKPIIRKRIVLPLAFNILNTGMFPIALLIATKYQYTAFILPLAFTVNVGEYLWTSMNQIENLVRAKFYLMQILVVFRDLERKYVINDRSFRKVCDYCKPGKDVLESSKVKKSLTLHNYNPIKYSKSKYFQRRYSFDFFPGIYQINGINGIGKSILLKSLAVPSLLLHHISEGEVALNGKEFFDKAGGLIAHRKRAIYVGNDSKQEKTIDIDLRYFVGYPEIVNALNRIKKEKHIVQSDGEKAIVIISNTICQILKNDSKERIIVLDEALSKICNNKESKLRDEITILLQRIVKKYANTIVFVVDHHFSFPGATQLRIDKTGISKS